MLSLFSYPISEMYFSSSNLVIAQPPQISPSGLMQLLSINQAHLHEQGCIPCRGQSRSGMVLISLSAILSSSLQPTKPTNQAF